MSRELHFAEMEIFNLQTVSDKLVDILSHTALRKLTNICEKSKP